MTVFVVLGALILAACVPMHASASKKMRCKGETATITGSAGADRLQGTRRVDVVISLAGGDRITRIGRRDVVCSGGGGDMVTSRLAAAPRQRHGREEIAISGGLGEVVLGVGDDELLIRCGDAEFSPDAFNSIAGGDGDDLIDSNCPFRDEIAGDAGDDRLILGLGEDLAEGGDGDDEIVDKYSTAEDCLATPEPGALDEEFFPLRDCIPRDGGWYPWEDRFEGGPGEDFIAGGPANDLIFGGDGDDHLRGGPGNDALSGGAQHDLCYGEQGDADVNGGAAGLPIGDCEGTGSLEAWEGPPPNCSRELIADSEQLKWCYWRRPNLLSAAVVPSELDVSEYASSTEVELLLMDRNYVPAGIAPGSTGVRKVTAELASSSGERVSGENRCTGPPYAALIQCVVHIPIERGSPDAVWRFEAATVHDDRGGWSRFTSEDLRDPVIVQPFWPMDGAWESRVYGGPGNPVTKLRSFSMSAATIDTRTGPQTIDVEFEASDPDGLGEAYVVAYPPRSPGDNFTSGDVGRSASPLGGTPTTEAHYSIPLTVPAGSRDGTWALRVYVGGTTFSASALSARGFPSSFEQVGPPQAG